MRYLFFYPLVFFYTLSERIQLWDILISDIDFNLYKSFGTTILIYNPPLTKRKVTLVIIYVEAMLFKTNDELVKLLNNIKKY